MEDFVYIDKNVYLNILILFLKKLKDYLIQIGILKVIFCLCIIFLSIFFAKRKNKKKKKINIYLQLIKKKNKNIGFLNNTKYYLTNKETSNKYFSKSCEDKKIEDTKNGFYYLTYSSHIFYLKTINRIELCNVCEENIYSFIFHKKNIFECVICRNQCHIECAPNSNLMSCKTSVFFKNKHKFIKLRNYSWNNKCDICNKKFYFFSFHALVKQYVYKCIWCNKYFHLKCLTKNFAKKKTKNEKNNKNICTYGNNKYILYPYQLSVKENVLIDYLVNFYNKINELKIKNDDLVLNYTINDFNKFHKNKKNIFENIVQSSNKKRNINELLCFDYINNLNFFLHTKNKKKYIVSVNLNFLLNFFPIHIPIYKINSNKKFLLIFVNVKSGGQIGKNLYQELLMYFNPIQIINIINKKNVLNVLNIFKEMFYLKKIILLICGGDGTISIFIDTLINFFLEEEMSLFKEKNKEIKIKCENFTNVTEKIKGNKDMLRNKQNSNESIQLNESFKNSIKENSEIDANNNTHKENINTYVNIDQNKRRMENCNIHEKYINGKINDIINTPTIANNNNNNNKSDVHDNNANFNLKKNVIKNIKYGYNLKKFNFFENKNVEAPYDDSVEKNFQNEHSLEHESKKNDNFMYNHKVEKLENSYISSISVENEKRYNNTYSDYSNSSSNNSNMKKTLNNNTSVLCKKKKKKNKKANIESDTRQKNFLNKNINKTKNDLNKEYNSLNKFSNGKYNSVKGDKIIKNNDNKKDINNSSNNDKSNDIKCEKNKVYISDNNNMSVIQNDKELKKGSKNYLLDSYISTTPICIMPLGTGNDLSVSLGWGIEYNSDLFFYLNKIKFSRNELVDVWNMKGYDLNNNLILNNSFINYCDIGIIARLALHFDNLRRNFPHFFNSRIGNKILYGEVGFRDICFNTYKYKLNKNIKIYCDGKKVNLDENLEGVCIINIPYFLGGIKIWKDDELEKNYYSDIESEKKKKKLFKKDDKSSTDYFNNSNDGRSSSSDLFQGCDEIYNKLNANKINKKKKKNTQKTCEYKCNNENTCSKLKKDEIINKDEKKFKNNKNDNIYDHGNIYKSYRLDFYKQKKVQQKYRKQKINDKIIEVIGFRNIFHLVQVQIGISKPIKLCQGSDIVVKINRKFIQNKNKIYFQYDGEPGILNMHKLHFTHKCQCLFLSPKDII
ncbi:diacylglycerol kinase, putative [Plasmodium gallinaceum]|uniref:diacylglycerol kinase (ATP) n=1 Tax=Plasmodium gallinaceum TaxID=5849 RepID=A0A1J1H0P6_PLAGA|nr:diacylglycerol kinase, putative [Plasmodium gallinaceum]CRG96853.1 diacylglycerol kinase, putative [Plasmodium gallinaceum]